VVLAMQDIIMMERIVSHAQQLVLIVAHAVTELFAHYLTSDILLSLINQASILINEIVDYPIF
jgi:hypothetical protein